MIALDTNIIVRALVNDDEKQAAASRRLLGGKKPVLVLDTVLLETVWVLESVYEIPAEEIAAALEALLTLPAVRMSATGRLGQVLAWYRGGMDFGDALHLSAADRCTALATFDRRFIQKAKGRSGCIVMKPA